MPEINYKQIHDRMGLDSTTFSLYIGFGQLVYASANAKHEIKFMFNALRPTDVYRLSGDHLENACESLSKLRDITAHESGYYSFSALMEYRKGKLPIVRYLNLKLEVTVSQYYNLMNAVNEEATI